MAKAQWAAWWTRRELRGEAGGSVLPGVWAFDWELHPDGSRLLADDVPGRPAIVAGMCSDRGGLLNVEPEVLESLHALGFQVVPGSSSQVWDYVARVMYPDELGSGSVNDHANHLAGWINDVFQQLAANSRLTVASCFLTRTARSDHCCAPG